MRKIDSLNVYREKAISINYIRIGYLAISNNCTARPLFDVHSLIHET